MTRQPRFTCLSQLDELVAVRAERDRLRAALVALGPLLTPCDCGCGDRCVRCRVLRQRAEALGEEISP